MEPDKNSIAAVIETIVNAMGTKTAVVLVTAIIAALTGSTGMMASQVDDSDGRLQGYDVALKSALASLTKNPPPPPEYLLEDCNVPGVSLDAPRKGDMARLMVALERCNADKKALRRYYEPPKNVTGLADLENPTTPGSVVSPSILTERIDISPSSPGG